MDARALLKAKRQDAKITHPYALYTSSGQLRCKVCSVPIKQASMWEGHLGSKAHRVNVMKAKEEVSVEAQMEAEPEPKKRRVEVPESQASFPSNFFSDPSRAIPESEEDEQEEEGPAQPPAAPPAAAKSQLDMEWEAFEATIASAPQPDEDDDKRETFQRATVFAEPVLHAEDLEGIPQNGQDPTPVGTTAKEETEEEKRTRLEQEVRELIMDRLLEEERAQEDADSRVLALKARLAAVKKARESRKTTKV